jgi:hypothetical protein
MNSQAHVVRTYDHIPQAFLSLDSALMSVHDADGASAAHGSLMHTTTTTSHSSNKLKSGRQGKQMTLSMPEMDDSTSEMSYQTHASTDVESSTGRHAIAGSTISAGDSAQAQWYADYKH